MTEQHTHRWARAIAMVTPYRPLRVGPDIVLARKRADPWERIYALEELARVEFLVALLSKLDVDVLVDVGANDGHFGSKLRRHGYHGRLLSFEPAPGVYERLARLSAADRRWDVFRVALGDREETAVLNLMAATTFNSFLKPNSLALRLFEVGTEIQGEVRVSVDRLDRILPTLLPDSDRQRVFLKIDTQGYDLNVLRGAGGQLESIVGLQVEMAMTPLYEGTPLYNDVVEFVEARGFALIAAFPVTWNSSEPRALEYDGIFLRKAT
ncbi:MAG: FkbM family methyltransferase [Gemmatimonadetes bacterium]|nr:FkbM family methyltransferase [Gemmatimonadota bacterium]